MIGYEIEITRLNSPELNSGEKLAYWRISGFKGIDWIDELVENGKAQLVKDNCGYPFGYTAKVKHVRPILKSGVPKTDGPTFIDDHEVSKGGSVSDVKINMTELDKLDDEEVLSIEAWDQS